MTQYVKHQKLNNWICDFENLAKPEKVHICDGSKHEYDFLIKSMIESGACTKLNSDLYPDSVLFRSDPSDVARVESRTYISTKKQESVGPTNNWVESGELRKTMTELYRGCMKGRTMYVIPFSMGPVSSPLARIGVEITDSPYVVVNMIIMTRVGTAVLEKLGSDGDFVPCLHSVGAPLESGQKDVPWPCAPIEKKYIAQFPEEMEIWSYGSGYGGNALLGKKCFALRLASVMARNEGWMAEHMLILRLTNPEGRQFHIAAAFPSACGKTNLAMILPTIEGWKAETIGDDIAWMKPGPDGRLYAINPESGFFGVAPGTNYKSNRAAMESCSKETIFTNCVLTPEGGVGWEGMDDSITEGIDWKGNPWKKGDSTPGAHPNARFTAKASNCPVICEDWEKPEGVPIDILLFGGRRKAAVPLVFETFDWDHGVFTGSVSASEATAAALDTKTAIRRDPFAMLPFCGYDMGEYFGHWLEMGDILGEKAPKIFHVNWFRRGQDGRFLWPGFGDNARVLKWMCERLEGKVDAVKTPVGYVPAPKDLDLAGLDMNAADLDEILTVNPSEWAQEVNDMEEFLSKFNRTLPPRITAQLNALKNRLDSSNF